jgi:hypothetical protein
MRLWLTQRPTEPVMPAPDPFSSPTRVFLIAIFAALVLLKIPGVLAGRLWAEDCLFLQDAVRLPWWQALATPHTGYIDLAASAAMLIATHVTDLEHVALASVAIALFVQLCPAVLLVTSGCEWLRPRWAMLTALLLVLMPPIAEEVWLSPVTSQYHLMVCTGLILAFTVRGGPIGVFRLLLLAVAGLTGPGTALAAPLFVARAYLERSLPRAMQAGVLSVGVLIEIAVFLTHPVGRHLGISPPFLLHVICVKHLLVPFFGPFVADSLNKMSLLEQFRLLPVISSLLALSALVWAVLTTRSREVRWLCAVALTMMALSYFGAIGGQDLLKVYPGGRYYYAPQVLLGLTLLGLARTGSVIWRSLATMAVTWLLFVGIREYRVINPVMALGPSWRDQVVQWRAQPGRPIIVWPPPSFQVHLDTLQPAAPSS